MGMKEGFHKASPVLLEPIMKVEIVTPEDYLGDVMGDVSRRRGILQGQDDTPSGKVINAMLPLGEMFGYATSLRSMSQGRATFTMEFRSEEHTSELQSLMRISYAVFCLKKKTTNTIIHSTQIPLYK